MAQDRRLLFLLQRARRAALAHVNARTLDRLGVSVAQLGTLSYLAQRHGCTMTEIAELLDLNKPAASAMLRRLERARLIRREPNPRDGRGTLLFLTAKGERVRLASRPVFQRAMSELIGDFAPSELEAVFRFLNALLERCKPDSSRRRAHLAPTWGDVRLHPGLEER